MTLEEGPVAFLLGMGQLIVNLRAVDSRYKSGPVLRKVGLARLPGLPDYPLPVLVLISPLGLSGPVLGNTRGHARISSGGFY